MQCVTSGVRRRDVVLMELARVTGAKIGDHWDKRSIPAFVGFLAGADEIQRECTERGIPYVFIDHAYFEMHRDKVSYEWSRICVSHYHTTDWRESDRWVPEVRPWKSGGDSVVILPPAAMVKKVYGADSWLRETIKTLEDYTDKRIVVKEKNNGIPLSEYFKNAHCIVSYGSVGEVEAAIAGVPVFTTRGPSLPIAKTDFTQVETPSYPDRGQWLSALAGAEWHLSELDKAWERIAPLIEENDVNHNLQRTANCSC